jgi:hypothetical protein
MRCREIQQLYRNHQFLLGSRDRLNGLLCPRGLLMLANYVGDPNNWHEKPNIPSLTVEVLNLRIPSMMLVTIRRIALSQGPLLLRGAWQ